MILSDGLRQSSNSNYPAGGPIQWGFAGTLPVPADYDGDRRFDPAVYNPANGTWYIRKSTGGVTIKQWGFPGATPCPADYDKDGKADLAVYNKPTGRWFILKSSDGAILGGSISGIPWGWSAVSPPKAPANF